MSAPAPGFVRRGYGSGRQVAAVDFVVFGLLTFWVYTCLRLRTLLGEHLEERWRELGAAAAPDTPRPAGFTPAPGPLLVAAGLFGLDALLVVGWFWNWILVGDLSDRAAILTAVGASSALFYAATLLCVLTTARTLRRHEADETLLRQHGAAAAASGDYAPSDALVARWEALHQRIALFLVAALPMAFSPTVGAHLFLNHAAAGHETLLAAACFVLAAAFHAWGSTLVLGLFNAHLAHEADQARPAGDAPAEPAGFGPGPGEPPRRELAAIMLTDICGYSKAMERDEEGTYARLLDHNKLLRTAIVTHRGREVKTIGDAFLVVFRSALDAVDCAVEIQRALADYNTGRAEDQRVLVRIGVHLGDVLITENDVFGDGVNVAARIEPLAEPGGICVSEEVYALVRKKVELNIERVEGATLKNIAQAPGIYRLRLRQT